jgi:hypothetical protein
MRPVGDIALALQQAAVVPGTVKALCQRAQVGYSLGRCTASRMLRRGQLVPAAVQASEAPAVRCGRGRPPLLVVAAQAQLPGQRQSEVPA